MKFLPKSHENREHNLRLFKILLFTLKSNSYFNKINYFRYDTPTIQKTVNLLILNNNQVNNDTMKNNDTLKNLVIFLYKIPLFDEIH